MVPAKAEAVLEGITEETLEGAAEKAAEKTDAVFLWEHRDGRIFLSVKGTAAHASHP